MKYKMIIKKKRVNRDIAVEVKVSGYKELYMVSRELTGTVFEEDGGIFSPRNRVMFCAKNESEALNLPLFPDRYGGAILSTDEIAEFNRVLKERVQIVRNWVESLEYKEHQSWEVDIKER